MCLTESLSAVLQNNRSSGLQRAEDADGNELHALRRVDFLLQSRTAAVSNRFTWPLLSFY